MSRTLWHRWPNRDLQAVLACLDALIDADAALRDDAERAQLQALRDEVARGFAAKQDGALDLELLIRSLEFSVVVCETDRAPQLRQVLQRVRSYQRDQPAVGG